MKNKLKAVLACVVAVILLMVAQIGASIVSPVPCNFGAPAWLGDILYAVCYILFAWLLFKLFIERVFKYPLASIRMGRPAIRWYWPVSGIVLIAVVYGALLLLPGSFTGYTGDDKAALIIRAIFSEGLGAAVVEEMTFRGACMGILEKNFNKYVAVLLPSVAFAAVHLMNGALPFLSAVQLIVAGTFVGVMFSLIDQESGHILNSASVHFLWNTMQGFLLIGTAAKDEALTCYVLKNSSQLLAGGDYGVDCSLFAIIGYALVIIAAFVLIRRRKTANT